VFHLLPQRRCLLVRDIVLVAFVGVVCPGSVFAQGAVVATRIGSVQWANALAEGKGAKLFRCGDLSHKDLILKELRKSTTAVANSGDRRINVMPASGAKADRRAPVIDTWYGDVQTFGQTGISQPWVNVLGNVSAPGGITSLTYSLNGGLEQRLRLGPDQFRLVNPGDFNAEIAYSSLRNGRNAVRFTATGRNGAVTRRVVTIDYVAGRASSSSYSIDWLNVPNIQNVAQIVDGKWAVQSGALRILQPGYDRLIDIGDMNTWANLVGTAEMTLNAIDGRPFGMGVIVGWRGHTQASRDDQPRTGHPFPASFQYSGTALGIYANTSLSPETWLVQKTAPLSLGVKYTFKFRVTPNSWGGSHFSFKAWKSRTKEPPHWQLEADGELARGSVLIGAHNADISVGRINITPLNGSEISRAQYSEEVAFYLELSLALSLVALWTLAFFSLRNRPLLTGAWLLLLVALPFCEPVTTWIIHLLQRGAAEIAYLIFRILGLPVIREGFFLSIRSVTTSVTRECGSIRSSMALLIICIVAARIILRTGWKALSFVLLSLPVSFIQNGMRIATLELVSLYPRSDFLQKNLHREGGLMFFFVGLLILSPVFAWFVRSERPAVSSLPALGVRSLTRPRPGHPYFESHHGAS
jgi:exosortase